MPLRIVAALLTLLILALLVALLVHIRRFNFEDFTNSVQAVDSGIASVVFIGDTLNNQMISAMTTLNVSLTLTPTINAANIQQMVRQAMANSLR